MRQRPGTISYVQTVARRQVRIEVRVQVVRRDTLRFVENHDSSNVSDPTSELETHLVRTPHVVCGKSVLQNAIKVTRFCIVQVRFLFPVFLVKL
jgi:hypothetical protein